MEGGCQATENNTQGSPCPQSLMLQAAPWGQEGTHCAEDTLAEEFLLPGTASLQRLFLHFKL